MIVRWFRRVASRLTDAYYEIDHRLAGSPTLTPERATRLLAQMDQHLAAKRDSPFIVCADPNCQPYGDHYRRIHGVP